MTATPADEPPDESDLDTASFTEEWAGKAAKHERSADDRADHYAAIAAGHARRQPPRSWTPAESAATGSTTAPWVKVTAIVLIVIAVLAVLSAVRAWG